MSNLKISQLPNFTGSTSGSWLIANNSGQSETFKIERENFLNGYAPSIDLTALSSSIAITDLNQNNAISALASSGSLTALSSSIALTDLNQNNTIATLATTSSLTSLSSSIAVTDLSQNNRLTSIESITGSFAPSGNYATTGSNQFNGNQSISGSVNISGSGFYSLIVSGAQKITKGILVGDNKNDTYVTLTSTGSGILNIDAGTFATLKLEVDNGILPGSWGGNSIVVSSGSGVYHSDTNAGGSVAPYLIIPFSTSTGSTFNTPSMTRGLNVTGSLTASGSNTFIGDVEITGSNPGSNTIRALRVTGSANITRGLVVGVDSGSVGSIILQGQSVAMTVSSSFFGGFSAQAQLPGTYIQSTTLFASASYGVGLSDTYGVYLLNPSGSVRTINLLRNTNITGSLIVSGSITGSADSSFNFVKIGRGLGNFSSNTIVSRNAFGVNTTGQFNTIFGDTNFGLSQTGSENTIVGYNNMNQSLNGNSNIAIGTGIMNNSISPGSNIGIGRFNLQYNTSGSSNVSIGLYSAQYSTGSRNVAVGESALNRALNDNIGIGYNAGEYETGSSKLYIDSVDRADLNSAISGSILYGEMNSVPANQNLRINSKAVILNGLNIESGGATISGSIIQTGSVQGNIVPLTITSNTASLNLNNGNFFTLQLVSGSATHLNPTNIKPGQTVSVFVNTTGSATMTFPSSIKQISGSAYIPTTGTGLDILTLISKDTSNLYLVSAKNMI
jgi:hypothetical protein